MTKETFKLSENSIKLIETFNTNYTSSKDSVYHLVCDFNKVKEANKFSTQECYDLYHAELLNPIFKMETFKNKLSWHKGTIEEFRSVPQKNFNKFCNDKIKDATLTAEKFNIQLKEKAAKKVEESAKKAEKKEESAKQAASQRVANNVLFHEWKNDPKSLYKTFEKMSADEIEQIRIFAKIMMTEKNAVISIAA